MTMHEHDQAAYREAVTGENADTFGILPVAVTVADPVTITPMPPRTLVTDQIPVDVLPVQLVGDRAHRARVTVAARGGTIYLGGENVTTTTGYMLAANESLTLDVTAALYAVATAAGGTAHVLAQHRDG